MSEILRLSPDAVAACEHACDAYIAGLTDTLYETAGIVESSSFGNLPSGQALGAKFASLTTGAPGSLDDILRQHIEAITNLKESFAQAGRNYAEAESATTAALTATPGAGP